MVIPLKALLTVGFYAKQNFDILFPRTSYMKEKFDFTHEINGC